MPAHTCVAGQRRGQSVVSISVDGSAARIGRENDVRGKERREQRRLSRPSMAWPGHGAAEAELGHQPPCRCTAGRAWSREAAALFQRHRSTGAWSARWASTFVASCRAHRERDREHTAHPPRPQVWAYAARSRGQSRGQGQSTAWTRSRARDAAWRREESWSTCARRRKLDCRHRCPGPHTVHAVPARGSPAGSPRGAPPG